MAYDYYAMVPYHESRRPHPLEEVVEPLEQFGFKVALEECASPDRYAEALMRWWAWPDPFLLVEHDVVCSKELLQSIWSCPELLCVGDYYWRFGLLAHISCHRIGTELDWQYIPGDLEWCDMVGFGVIKFTPELKRQMPWQEWLINRGGWSNLDSQFSNVLTRKRIRAHIHRPVADHRVGLQKPGWA